MCHENQSNNILITGGAGYIGSHVVKLLGEKTKHEICTIDNLTTGKMKSVLYGDFIQGDICDQDFLNVLFASRRFDAVFHFAASIIVPESFRNPEAYYQNNFNNTMKLVQCCLKHGIGLFVFSSSAAVYGDPKTGLKPIDEAHPVNPINPYGRTKLACEWYIQDASRANPDFRHVILRYFNVAGASPDNLLGPTTPNPTHLIRIAAQTALGKIPFVNIHGDDYPTPDGTCIRDYIHVQDLAEAHLACLDYLASGQASTVFNCGYGQGYSVREVLEAMREIGKFDFHLHIAPRRPGDPASLVADASRLRKVTGLKPCFNDLEKICQSALNWEKSL